MDENEIEIQYEEVSANKHDRWSILVPALSTLSEMVSQVAGFAAIMTEIAVEHANYRIQEDKLKEIARTWGKR